MAFRRSISNHHNKVQSGFLEERICELRSSGMGILKIARTLGIGVSVVQRVVA